MEAISLKLEQYEGPLDLLLSLITKNKIDIFDIPIADLAEQYMDYIDKMRELDMDVASEFILMAAELMLIKSRLLLPKTEEDPRKPLVDALLEYQRAKLAAEFLKLQSELYYDRFTKPSDPFEPEYNLLHETELLTQAFSRIAQRLKTVPKEEVELFEKFQKEHYYTVEGKILTLLRIFKKSPKQYFEKLFTSRNISELIATFLALLELVKSGRIDVNRTKDGIWLEIQDK